MSTLTKQWPPDKNYVLFMTPTSHIILINQILIFLNQIWPVVKNSTLQREWVAVAVNNTDSEFS